MTPTPGHSLRDLFGGLVEQVFMAELGICDPALTDYLTALLAEFVHVDQIHRFRTVDGQVIREVAQMEAAAYLGANVDATRRTCVVNRFIGDFTLFWAGVYPENLRRARMKTDRLQEYLLQGRRSYGIASELIRADERPPAEVFRNLSAQFEFCVHGLHLVRAGWEALSREPRRN